MQARFSAQFVSIKMFILTQLLIPVALLSSVVIGLPLNDDDRIFGGKEAAIGQFPYVAQIRGHTEIGSFRHCDGAILTARHILTVASCRIERYPDPEEYEVVVGTVEGMVHNGTIYNLERWIIHEDYYADITKTNATIRNDIALIVTDSKIKFTKLVAPISLHRGFIKGGSQAVATGWGSFNVSEPFISQVEVVWRQVTIIIYLQLTGRKKRFEVH